MEETKELAIPEGYEFDRVEGGEVILKKKKQVFPGIWEDCLFVVNDVDHIDERACIIDYSDVEDMYYDIGEGCRPFLPFGLGKPMLALCQLLVCRNAWWKILEWRPDWENIEEHKFCIYAAGNTVLRGSCRNENNILAFPDPETRDRFLDSFRDLIEEAKELL